jgi:hypothetical protein
LAVIVTVADVVFDSLIIPPAVVSTQMYVYGARPPVGLEVRVMER